MKALILCGGLGTRLNLHKNGMPKALVKINQKPLILYILENLWKHSINDIRLSLGFGADRIVDFIKKEKIDVEYVIEDKKLGTGGALKFASRDLDDFFLALNGDIISDINLREFMNFHRCNPNTYKIVSYKVEKSSDFGFLKIKDNYVTEFQEKPSKSKAGYVNAGFYILHRNIFKDINNEVFSIERDIFPELVKKKKLQYFHHKGFWLDVGTFERLDLAQEIFSLRSLIL